MLSALHPPAVAGLAHAVDELAAEDLRGGDDAALGTELVEIRRQIDRLEADFSRRLLQFESAHGPRAAGATSTVAWLRHHCHLSGPAAAERVVLAQQLGHLPQLEEVFRRGDVGYAHAAIIARTAAQVGPEVMRDAEPMLVDAAQQFDPGRLWLISRHLRHCVDPDGTLADSNLAFERRLHLSRTYDGVFVLDGHFDAEGGELLHAAISSLDGPPAPGDTREPWQRRADALVELARRQLQGGELPSAYGVRPHLTLTVSEPTLQLAVGAPGAELAWAGVLPAASARRIACDAALTKITLDPTGQPLNVGRTTRTVPSAIRRALAVRDRGCVFPGCDRPQEWTDAHHLKHWADGGETSLENLGLLCRIHHRCVHEDGWQLHRNERHELIATPP